MTALDVSALSKTYEELDRAEVASLLAQAVQLYLRGSPAGGRRTYKDLAAAIFRQLGTSAKDEASYGDRIKTFVSRVAHPSAGRINSNNDTLRTLYLYFMSGLDTLDGELAGLLRRDENWRILTGRIDYEALTSPNLQKAAAATNEWMDVREDELTFVADRLLGDRVLLHKTAALENSETMIVRSDLHFSWDARKTALLCHHRHWDRFGIERNSSGFVTPLKNNSILMTLRVEKSQAIETMVFRIPIQKQYVNMIGFITTVTMNRDLVSARAFLTRDDAHVFRDRPPRFDRDELDAGSPERIAVDSILNSRRAKVLAGCRFLPSAQEAPGATPTRVLEPAG